MTVSSPVIGREGAGRYGRGEEASREEESETDYTERRGERRGEAGMRNDTPAPVVNLA